MVIGQTLRDIFGFERLKPGQRQVIEKIMAGDSAAAIFPTGAGKSLCYQLPALHESGMSLIISPLLSLMKDQVEFLKTKNIPAAKLDSGMASADYRETIAAARQGKLKILMISVERFKNERFRTQLQQMDVSLMVVDEAHCISEWGHNFRPDYLKIPLYQREFNVGKVLLLTATATPKVVVDMCRKFSIPESNVVMTGFHRQNLMLHVLPTLEEQKDDVLRQVLSGPPHGPGIVYVTFQKTAETVARMLAENGFIAAAYHAGMGQDQRDAVQNHFMASQNSVVVATIAFGMGIDKDNIRQIVHYDLPKSLESYSQEIGRAGRDGALARCTVLANRNGVPALENFVYGDTPSIEGIRHVLSAIQQAGSRSFEVRPYALSRETDIRILSLKTLLVYLEMENVISPRYTYFEQYPFQFLTSDQEIIAQFKDERRQFVKTIFSYFRTAKKWVYPDIEAIISASRSDRQRILTALEYFHEKGWVELQPRSSVEVFEILAPIFNIDDMAQRLSVLFAKKESKDVARLHTMIKVFETERCLSQSLSEYFGEHLARPCGQCSVCLSGEPVQLPEIRLPALDSFNLDDLIFPLVEMLGSPLPAHVATRFLCGISSPRLVQCKAKQLPGFGRLEKYPYKIVEQWVTQSDHVESSSLLRGEHHG